MFNHVGKTGVMLIAVVASCIFLLCQCGEEDTTLPKVVDFNFHIRPILSQNCYTCHGPDGSSRKAGLRLDTRDGATSRLSSGNRAIVSRSSGKSEIMRRLRSEDLEQIMPPPESKKKLTAMEIALIEKWIDQGAKWKKHWSFISPQESDLQHNQIDGYISDALTTQGLSKGEEASKSALIRRVSYIATGLPPSPHEIERFESSKYEEIVDYYLASDHYGEHWARHWMDLVRYAEGMGHEFDFTIGGAWHYRDYLIRAFNADVPYDLFVKEHLAGDMLASPRVNTIDGYNESVIGTAYAFLGEGKHSPVDIKKEESDRIDNLIDVTSKTFQGLTIACAKCHDHKFDPIPTTDYYSMYGMFESSRIGPVTFASNPEKTQIQQEIQEINETLKGKVAGFIANIDLEEKEEATTVTGDFRAKDFGDWNTTGDAFGDKPLYDRFASSRYYGPGISGTLRSPNFTIQDSFIYVYASGHGSTIRIIVDNFQLIQNPLYGNLFRDINDEKWRLHKMNVSNLIGHKAYIELLPGHYNRHHYEINNEDYIEVQTVFMADASLNTDQIDSIAGEFDLPTAGLFDKKKELSYLLYDSSFVMGMSEGDAVFSPVFIRGSHTEPSEDLVPHGFISAVGMEESEFPQDGSGRLAWAKAVVDHENPLTSRVMVNRIWHHVFGSGIVTSVDNFGLQGSLPSHPELLDFLAVTFIENEWSVKSLIKQIMLSETFKTSTVVNEQNASFDPQNRYLSSFPVRRLDAESIRDGMMVTAGTIDKKLYGESVPVHLTEFMTGRGRPAVSGPLDGYGRRSIYIGINRNFLSPMMLTFDMPIPFSTFGKRNTTNVPAQSLILMNDPFVHCQSEKWAEKILHEENVVLNQKIKNVFLAAYGRAPTAPEIENAIAILGDFDDTEEMEAWKNYCHIIFNTKEFIHLL